MDSILYDDDPQNYTYRKIKLSIKSGPFLIDQMIADQILIVLKQGTTEKEQKRYLTLEFPKTS